MSNYYSQPPQRWTGAPHHNDGIYYSEPMDIEMESVRMQQPQHHQQHRSAFRPPINHPRRQPMDTPPVRNPRQNLPNKHSKSNNRPKEVVMEPMEIYQNPESAAQPRKNKTKATRPPRGNRQIQPNPLPPSQRQQCVKRSEIGICTKYILFVVNFIVFIVGVGLTSLGGYILHIKAKTVHDAIDFFLDPSCDMCLVGSIFLVMGFIGLVGSLRENTFFLKMHYYLMALLLLVQLTLCILIFVAYFYKDVRDKIFPMDSFKDAIRKYRDDIDMQNLIDNMQKELKCCGVTDNDQGYLDWNENRYFKCNSNNTSPESCSVPSSCCKRQHGQAVNHQCGWKVLKADKNGFRANEVMHISSLNTQGCLKALGDWMENHALSVGGGLCGALLPQIFQMVLSSRLVHMIQLQKKRW